MKKSRKTINHVNIRDGVAYEVNADTPYTGLYKELEPKDAPTGLITLLAGEFKNGLRKGNWTVTCVDTKVSFKQPGVSFWRNEQKFSRDVYKCVEFVWKNGKKNGTETYFSATGQKQEESNYLDGKQAGKFTKWYEAGHKQEESNYLDGKQAGKFTKWYDNGQKQEEALNGRRNGYYKQWHQDGRKKKRVQPGFHDKYEFKGVYHAQHDRILKKHILTDEQIYKIEELMLQEVKNIFSKRSIRRSTVKERHLVGWRLMYVEANKTVHPEITFCEKKHGYRCKKCHNPVMGIKENCPSCRAVLMRIEDVEVVAWDNSYTENLRGINFNLENGKISILKKNTNNDGIYLIILVFLVLIIMFIKT